MGKGIKLSTFKGGTNSQFGEDGIIRECLKRMDLLKIGTCIEVGASDGRDCSNTLELRDLHGWNRILIEGDPVLCKRHEKHEWDTTICAYIEEKGPKSLDKLVPTGCDFLSLDIDGNEYEVLRHLSMRPALIVSEFNQTIPWHMDVKSPQFGPSLKALFRLMRDKEYRLVTTTHCNAFFIEHEYLDAFTDVEFDPSKDGIDPDNFTYLVSTPYGGVVAFGPQYFGVKSRYSGPIDVIDAGTGDYRTINLSPDSIRP